MRGKGDRSRGREGGEEGKELGEGGVEGKSCIRRHPVKSYWKLSRLVLHLRRKEQIIRFVCTCVRTRVHNSDLLCICVCV